MEAEPSQRWQGEGPTSQGEKGDLEKGDVSPEAGDPVINVRLSKRVLGEKH